MSTSGSSARPKPSGSVPAQGHVVNGGWFMSMDWFKGKSTGNHRFYHQIWVFPVKFPFIQSIDYGITMYLVGGLLNLWYHFTVTPLIYWTFYGTLIMLIHYGCRLGITICITKKLCWFTVIYWTFSVFLLIEHLLDVTMLKLCWWGVDSLGPCCVFRSWTGWWIVVNC